MALKTCKITRIHMENHWRAKREQEVFFLFGDLGDRSIHGAVYSNDLVNWISIPSRGGVEILLVASCYRNRR